jgi:hypothetical protein
MVKRLLFRVIFVALALLLAAAAPPFVTSASAGPPVVVEASAQQKPAKKQKKTKRKKPAPAKQAEPEKAKEPWQLPMTVVVVRQIGSVCEPLCPEWIAAEGEITAATPALFRKMLERLGNRQLPVLIQSPGGDVTAALEIGRLLRKAKLDVTVSGVAYEGCAPHVKSCRLPGSVKGVYRGTPLGKGYCASACPLILAGGVNRLASSEAGIGLHKIRTTWTQEHVRYQETYRIENGKKKVISRKVISRKNKSYTKDGLDKRLRKKLTAYLKEMAISPAILEDMEKAPYSEMNWLQPQRARELGLVTSHDTGIGLFELLRLCSGSNPRPNCVARAFEMPPPKPGTEMIVTRMRATGACEPFCPEWIAADGVITPGTPKLFAAILKELGGKKLPVFLNSTHGDFDAALEIGRMIRKRQLVTAVAVSAFTGCDARHASCRKGQSPGEPYKGRVHRFGECGRECLLVLAGGTDRYAVNAAGTDFAPPESLFSRKTAGAAVEEAEAYLREMSISPNLLRIARSGTSSKPVLLSAVDIRILRLGTETASPAFMVEPLLCRDSSGAPNCVVRAKVPPPPSPAEEMVIVRVRATGTCEPLCPEWISAEGVITAETPAAFRAVLRELGDAKLPVLIHSKGGDVDAAIQIGKMIRESGLKSVVAVTRFYPCEPRRASCGRPLPTPQLFEGSIYEFGECQQACLFMLAGGVERYISFAAGAVVLPLEYMMRKTSRKGAEARVGSYLRDMSVSPDLLELAKSGKDGDPIILGLEQMRSLRLGTRSTSGAFLASPQSCEGRLALPNCIARARPRAGKEMTIIHMRTSGSCEPVCPEWIMADGIITPDTPGQFRALLNEIGQKKLPIILNSYGGDFDAAIAIGRMVRERKLDTVIAALPPAICSTHSSKCKTVDGIMEPPITTLGKGECSRECLFVLAGGMSRLVLRANVVLFYSPRILISAKGGQLAAAQAEEYLDEMGISADFMNHAWNVSRSGSLSLDPYDLIALKFGNVMQTVDNFTSPDACQVATPAPNCIRREKQS